MATTIQNTATNISGSPGEGRGISGIVAEEPLPAQATQNPNLKIYDEALALLESSPLQKKQLSSGEVMSYREYHVGQPHTLVVLPGFMVDDTILSLLAVLPELQDHHIIAVNPIGWNNSTMKRSIQSHEENADEVMDLLRLMKVEKAMAMGLSTGGGIAFYLAKKYPDKITAAFLLHSIPLDGLRFMTVGEELVVFNSLEELHQSSSVVPSMEPDFLHEFFKSMSTSPNCFIPREHKLNEYFTAAAINFPGSQDAGIANVCFNATPIKTSFSPPSDDLAELKSKVIVIHGSKDAVVPWNIVESLTKLAISEQWAPPGTLSLYNDDLGHMSLIDSPKQLAKFYRLALEEQVLTAN